MTYVPLDGRSWHHAMGLRPLDSALWLEFGSDADVVLAEKTRLLATHRADVWAELPESIDGIAELEETILANLRAHHPDRVRLAGDPNPLIRASLLVCEDLCLLQQIDSRWTLTAATVCFPSRWRLADKIGTDVREIHEPVPGYDTDLAAPVDRFFDRLTPRRPFWRLNWTLLDDSTLFQPGSARHSPETDPTKWHFRVERQSLSLLPRTSSAVFTIRTYVTPAAELAVRVPNFTSDVLTVLRTAPPETLHYKGWAGLAVRWAAAFGLPESHP